MRWAIPHYLQRFALTNESKDVALSAIKGIVMDLETRYDAEVLAQA